MEPFHPAPSAARPRLWLDGEPCDHPGCGKLLTLPCEGCGRIGARGTSALGFVVDDGSRDKFFRGNVELPEGTDIRKASSVEFSQEMTVDEAKRRFPDRAEELELKRRKAHPVERRIEDIPRLKAALALPDDDQHIAAHSHVLSSTNPTPRVVDTATEAAEAALRMKKLPPTAKIAKAKKRVCKFCEGKLERWSATTLRCSACGRNEAL